MKFLVPSGQSHRGMDLAIVEFTQLEQELLSIHVAHIRLQV